MIYIAQQKEIISTINNLIETLKDGEEGFKQASAAVKDRQLVIVISSPSRRLLQAWQQARC